MSKKKTKYITNNYLLQALQDYKNNPNDSEYKDNIAKSLRQIAERLIYSKKFIGYPEELKTEMLQDAVVKMYENIDGFDSDRGGNPFSFFTSIAFNIYRKHLNMMKKRFSYFVSTEALEGNAHLMMIDDKNRDVYDANKISERENNILSSEEFYVREPYLGLHCSECVFYSEKRVACKKKHCIYL